MSSIKKQLRYVALSVQAFAGLSKKSKVKVDYPKEVDISEALKNIDKDAGVVIVFPEGYPYVEIEGNQAVGKTSLIECLKEAAGNLASANTVHQGFDDKGNPVADKKYSERFWGTDGLLYSLKVTKTTITLEQIEVDEDGKPTLDKNGNEIRNPKYQPKTLLQKIIGPAGISPLKLKEMNGAEQVKWLRSLYNLGVEEERFEVELKDKYNKVYKERTNANELYKKLQNGLNTNVFFQHYEKWQTYFDNTNIDDLLKEVAGVTEQKDKYIKAVNFIPQLEEQKKRVQEDIDDLETQMKALQTRLSAKIEDRTRIEVRIGDGEKYVNDNKHVLAEYDALADKIKEASEFGSNKASFEHMVRLKQEMDHMADEKIRLDNIVTELGQKKKDYVKVFSPNIPDFEVMISDGEDKREGLFYKNKTLVLLAESELWEFATQLWKALGIKIIYVENVSSLGTGAIEKFNEFLASGGCYIFGTKMNRQEDNLKISFHTNIPI